MKKLDTYLADLLIGNVKLNIWYWNNCTYAQSQSYLFYFL